jgi:hypothetical protein
MNKSQQIARQEQVRRLARKNPYYAYELKKKHLDNRSEREVEVKRISKEMRI